MVKGATGAVGSTMKLRSLLLFDGIGCSESGVGCSSVPDSVWCRAQFDVCRWTVFMKMALNTSASTGIVDLELLHSFMSHVSQLT